MTNNYKNQNIEHTDKLEILLNKEIWDHMAIKEIGIEEGRAQGIEQGRLDNQKEMIKTMYKEGMSKEDIHKYTNIPMELIEETLK